MMKYEIAGLMLVVALLGAACASSPVSLPAPVPCAELSADTARQIVGREVVLVSPKTLGSGLVQCSYYARDLELLFTTIPATDSLTQFIANTRNVFPTGAQPSIDDRIDANGPAALVTYQSGVRVLYVQGASRGVLITTEDATITREMLINVGKNIATPTP